MTLAPIVLFVYNRPEHTKLTLDALAHNELATASELYVFSDGPKRPQDHASVNAIRNYLQTVQGFKSVTIIPRVENYGLARSVIEGVTEIVNKHGKIIVLEDDLVTSPYFLQYMNDALNLYEHDDQVMSVHAYIYPFVGPRPETFFLREIDCWGWGTWKRSWSMLELDGSKLLAELRAHKLTREFDLNYGYHFTTMLKEQIAGLNNSWAIRWYASAFLRNKLGLYPRQSLVKNIGFDNSGVHSGALRVFDVALIDLPVQVARIPALPHAAVTKLLERYFKSPKNFIIFQLIRLKNELRLIYKRVW